MTLSKTEQELLETWNSIKEDNEKYRERNEFQLDLEDLLEQEVKEELSDEQTETLNAYKTLFNYEVEYGYKCSYSLDCSEIEQEEECSKEELIDYLKGDTYPDEPDAHDSVCSGEVDIWVDYTGDIRPKVDISEFSLKEIYTNFTPMKNVVAPITENTSELKLVLQIQETKEGLSEEDLTTFGNTLMGMVNSFNGDYSVSAVVTEYPNK